MARAPTTATPMPPPERRMAFTPTPKPFTPLPNRGEWSVIGGAGELQKVVETDSAAMARSFFAGDEAHSLPDVWSMVEGFAQALFEPNHERHDTALREWRGLLACLALAGDFIPSLLVRRIDLAGTHPFLRVAASLLPQLPIMAQQYVPGVQGKFSEIGSMHFRGDLPPLGLLVPTCLVCTARSLPESFGDLAAKVPWIAEGALHDPTVRLVIATQPRAASTRCGKEMTEAHYRTLGDYLQGLLDHVGTVTFDTLPNVTVVMAARNRLGSLRGLLEAYHTDARSAADAVCAQLGQPRTIFTMQEAPSVTIPAFQDPLYGTGALLRFRIAQETGDGLGISDLRLRVRPEAASLFADVILADPDATLNGGKTRTVVWGQLTVQQMGDQPGAADNLQRAEAPQNRLILGPREIFTDRLVRLTAPGRVPGHTQDSPEMPGQLPTVNFVLPLTPLALLLFDRLTDVRNPRIRFLQRDGDRVAVVLTLDRLDRNNTLQSFQLVREYAPAMINDAPGTINRATPLVLALWPDLHSDDWKWFQIFSESETNDSVGDTHRVLPLWPVSAENLANIVNAAVAAGGSKTRAQCALALVRDWDALRAADTSSGRVAAAEIPIPRNRDKRLLQSQFRPEAYLIGAPERHGRRDGVSSADGFIMLPEAPYPKAETGKSMTLGVDFGSSNTTVFGKFTDNGRTDDPAPLTFGVRMVDITEPLPPDITEFYARHERPVPMLTVLADRQLRNAANFSNIPGADGYVFPVVKTDRAIYQATSKSPPMQFNIKWNVRDAEQAKRFLRHLALMSLAECADKGVPVTGTGAVTWRLSYPSAFTRQHYNQFVNMFVLILNDLGLGMGPLEIATESVCAARYFQREKMGAAAGTTIVLDIGGGTTDMAIWQQGQLATPLIWQGSVLFAGRQLVVEPLAHDLATSSRPEDGEERATLLGMIATGPQNDDQTDFTASLGSLGVLLRDGSQDPAAQPDAGWLNMVGLIVNSRHFATQTQRMLTSGSTHDGLERVIQAIEFGFAGILWFVGQQIRRLKITVPEEGSTRPGLDSALTREIVICLGGRPSLLLRGLLAARHRADHGGAQAAGKAFKHIFLTAAGENPTSPDAPFVRFDYSKPADAKREVAYGLLIDGATIATTALIKGTILGEAGTQGGKRFDADTFLKASNISQTQPVLPAADAPEIQAFLRCLQEVGTRLRDSVTLPAWQPTPNQLRNAVVNAGNSLQSRFDELHPPTSEADAPAAPAALTQEIQPPFFAVLHELMREMIRT